MIGATVMKELTHVKLLQHLLQDFYSKPKERSLKINTPFEKKIPFCTLL